MDGDCSPLDVKNQTRDARFSMSTRRNTVRENREETRSRRNVVVDRIGSQVHQRIGSRSQQDTTWWRYNRSIRLYGLTLLLGTKLADVVTTVIGIRLIPMIAETNPVAEYFFEELGLVTGLSILGFASVFLAACTAELLGIEVRRRYGLPKTALFAQISIYLILSILFGLVALSNADLISDQVAYLLEDQLLLH